MKAKEWFLDAAKGASLGMGVLPGVSAGTVGIIVNVYDKLLGNVNSLRKDFKRSFLTLLPIVLGVVIAAIVLLFAEHKAWDYVPFPIVAVCAGFIIGGLPVILNGFGKGKVTAMDVVRILLGFVIASGIGILSVIALVKWKFSLESWFADPYANWWIFPILLVVGFVTLVACLVPGVSGSMVLFICGLYDPIVGLYISSSDSVSMFHDSSKLVPGLIMTAILVLGGLIGIFAVSKVMKNLLDHHRRGTYGVVLGFVLGSIIAMFVNNQIWPTYSDPNTNQPWQYIVGGALLLAVASATFLIIRRIQKKHADQPKEGN